MTRHTACAGILALLLATSALAQTTGGSSTGTGSPDATTGSDPAASGGTTGATDPAAGTGSADPSAGGTTTEGGASSDTGTTGGASGSSTAAPATETPAAETAITGPGGRTFGQGWSTSVGSAFFTDTSLSTVRPAADITAQWGTLSEEDRAAVREDCAAYRTDAESMNGAASGGVSDTSTTTTASGEAGGSFKVPNVDQGDDGFIGETASATSADAGATEPAAATGTGVTAAHMQQICGVVDTL